MRVDAAGADLAVGDEFEDVRGAQLGGAAVGAERVVGGLESFDGAYGARTFRRYRIFARGRTWMFRFGVGGCIADSFDTHICHGWGRGRRGWGLINNFSQACLHIGLGTGTWREDGCCQGLGFGNA